MSPSKALQELRSRFAGTHRVGEVGAAIAITLALISTIPPFADEVGFLSYDLSYFARPKVEITNAVIVFLDDESHQYLNQTPGSHWHRALHVALLRKLKEQRASAVVFDVLLDESWIDIPNLDHLDKQLERAIKEHPELEIPLIPRAQVDAQLTAAATNVGKVLLAASAPPRQVSSLIIGTRGATFPFDMIRTNANWGFIEFENPGIRPAVRCHWQDPNYPESLARRGLEMMAGEAQLPPKIRWINYYGPAGTIESKSYYQVLQRDGIHSNFFARKIVFVGMGDVITPEGSGKDTHPTPYKLMQGVEIQANACLNYIRGDYLTRLSKPMQLLVFVITGFFFGLLFGFVRPWIAVILGVVSILAVAHFSIKAVWQTHVWWSWATVAGIQIPAALTWAFAINTRRLYREKVRLEHALATATSAPPATASTADTPTVVAGVARTFVVPRDSSRSPDADAAAGDMIADHELVRCVGEGAYGQVWLARNVIGTYSAIKIVYRKKFDNQAPFEREFQGLRRFMPISRGHPGFVQILHVGKNDEHAFFYYVMEAGDDEQTGQQINPDAYTPRNLSGDLQKQGRLPVQQCLKLAIDLSAALDYLHQQQLIHRDIKPSNIIFVNGVPKIADIGLVTVMATTRVDSTYIGTPGYIPPEGPGSAAADVFSLGKVIYEASMGRNIGNYPALPTTLIERPDYKGLIELNEIILRACADNVRLRYQSAGALHADLLRLQERLEKSPAPA